MMMKLSVTCLVLVASSIIRAVVGGAAGSGFHRHSSRSSRSKGVKSPKRSNIGPYPFFLSPFGKFRWQASLDSASGRASSQEVSQKEWHHHYETPKASQQSVFRVSDKLIGQYPQWLVRPKVTLGLLTCSRKDPETKETSIRPRFWNRVDLLTFGPIQVSKKSNMRCKWKLPITGGLLVDHSSSISSSSSSGSLGEKKRDMGCLVFETTTTSTTAATTPPSLTCRFESSIAGNYGPWIAGPAPIPSHRKWTYLCSQSIVHAYVMWRFHNAWNKRVTVVC
jgi:hypothetical protein